MSLPSYSIAIRTLGKSGDKFRRELESIAAQTVQPVRVMVYIAEGYPRPDFTVGREEYVWVKKGMVAQRALRYDEIAEDCILALDDDVLLSPDSAERLLRALAENDADCVGADVFHNQDLPVKAKAFAAVSNLVFPHSSRKWAFKIRRNGSFSYNAHPQKRFYLSQSCGGPAALWRKEALLGIHIEDELWMDSLDFSYGDDALISYKLHFNGGRLGVLYDSGVENLDAQSFSGAFRRSPEYISTRIQASFMAWWRSCYRTGADTAFSRTAAALAYMFKVLWLVPVHCAAALVKLRPGYISSYFGGLRDGWKAVHTSGFRSLPSYRREIR